MKSRVLNDLLCLAFGFGLAVGVCSYYYQAKIEDVRKYERNVCEQKLENQGADMRYFNNKLNKQNNHLRGEIHAYQRPGIRVASKRDSD